MNPNQVTLTPAYGRHYDTPGDAARDYEDGKDFILFDLNSQWNGKPADKTQLEAFYGIIDVQLTTSAERAYHLWNDYSGLLIDPSEKKVPGKDRAFVDGDPCPDCGEPLTEMFGIVGCMQSMGCKLDPMG